MLYLYGKNSQQAGETYNSISNPQVDFQFQDICIEETLYIFVYSVYSKCVSMSYTVGLSSIYVKRPSSQDIMCASSDCTTHMKKYFLFHI